LFDVEKLLKFWFLVTRRIFGGVSIGNWTMGRTPGFRSAGKLLDVLVVEVLVISVVKELLWWSVEAWSGPAIFVRGLGRKLIGPSGKFIAGWSFV
jgi:hypothetical protein